jgi:uncharacterized protein YecE (DUF72 family)
MKRPRSEFQVGCSGYLYASWANGVFYPPGIPSSKWLPYYASQFDTVEINNSFYRLPPPEVFASWRRQTPANFAIFVKGSRFVSHMKKLKDPVQPVQRFLTSVRPLKGKFAGVLWQLPRNFKCNIERLREFVREFRRHCRARMVFEFRHPSWFNADVTEILRDHHAVYCDADAPEFYRGLNIPETADFIYLRRHGGSEGGNYTRAELQRLAAQVRDALKRGKSVFVYFNNDWNGYAPRNARELLRLCGTGVPPVLLADRVSVGAQF